MKLQANLIILLRLLLATLFFAAACGLAWLHPRWPIQQLIGCVVFATIGWARPWWFAALFPILWVAADAYPWTGQLLLREYDSLLLANVAGVLLERRAASGECREKIKFSWSFVVALVVLTVAVTVATTRGWRTLPSSEWGDQLSVYFAQQNSLRVAKGYAWGILYAVLLMWQSRVPGRGLELRRLFALGGTIGVAYVAGGVAVERWLYQSLWDFSEVYRATGPIWTMHIGDQHVDAVLVMGLPLIWYRSGTSLGTLASGWGLMFRLSLTSLVLYAAVATMSRGTLAAVGAEVLIAACVLVRQNGRKDRPEPEIKPERARLVGALVFAGMVATGLGIVLYDSPALKSRFMQSGTDWQIRANHWRTIVAASASSPTTLLVGHGSGTIPTFLAGKAGRAIPPVQWLPTGDGGTFVLRTGWPLYLERSLGTREPLTLSGRVDGKVSSLAVIRCYKMFLQSYEHSVQGIDSSPQSSGFSVTLSAPEIDAGQPWQRGWRMQTLSLFASGPRTADLLAAPVERVELSDLRLEPANKAVVDRQSNSSPWFFTCDDHLVWRAKNMWIHTLYEQGLLGVLALGTVCYFGWAGTGRTTGMPVNESDDWNRSVWGVALVGFAIVGTFATLLDTPWITAWAIALLVNRRAV